MGTSRTGRILNTRGSERTISDYVLVHSVEGTYANVGSNDPKKPVRLKSGGHGQQMFDILKKNNIEYTITHVFPNGVRAGNVENHVRHAKRLRSKHLWFPKEWTEKDILEAGELSFKAKKESRCKTG